MRSCGPYQNFSFTFSDRRNAQDERRHRGNQVPSYVMNGLNQLPIDGVMTPYYAEWQEEKADIEQFLLLQEVQLNEVISVR